MSSPCRVAMIHTVPDYDRWFELLVEARREMPGTMQMTVHRSVDDPNEVLVELEVPSIAVAREAMQSPGLRDLLDRAGIDFYPPVFIGERVDELSG